MKKIYIILLTTILITRLSAQTFDTNSQRTRINGDSLSKVHGVNGTKNNNVDGPLVAASLCSFTGSILREVWNNIDGSTVSSIPYNTVTPDNVSLLSSFEGPTNVANLYGARYRGYICVPVSGNYTFWIASDDNSELWLSTNDNPANRVRIAYVNGWTYPRTYNKYASQQSAPIPLVAGQAYYIEALHKEAYGNDNLSVGWQIPGGALERPIPGVRLVPYRNSLPTVRITSPVNGQNFNAPTNITINATASDSNGTVTKVEFYDGAVRLGTDATSPYSFIWNNAPVGTHKLTAKAFDNDGGVSVSDTVTIVVAGSCTSAGYILDEIWNNVAGSTVTTIPVNTTPSSVGNLYIFEGVTNRANLYGERIRGYICVPTTGNYTFWIASDDNSELWLSTNESPANKTRIAYVNGWTYPRTYDKYPSQQSAPIYLVANRKYYIEALHKEAYGNDNISVGWRLPNGTLERPIPGNRLSPYIEMVSIANSNQKDAAIVSEDIEGEINVSISPNPTGKGTAKIHIDGRLEASGVVTIEILNLQGQSVYKDQKAYEGGCDNLFINIDDRFQPGIYVVHLLVNGQPYIEKIIVE